MKNYLIAIFSALTFSLVFVSCSEDAAPIVNGESFEIESFDDYLWKTDPVDTISFEINTEFQQCDGMSNPVVLALCDKDGELVKENLATVYVNGMKAENNRIELLPSGNDGMENTSTRVGIVIDRSALSEDCTFFWRFKCISSGDVAVLGVDSEGQWVNLDGNGSVYGTDICIKNIYVANSLKVWTNTIVLVVLSVIVAWILLLQINVPRFNQKHIRSIFIITNGARRCITNCTPDADHSVEIVISSQELKQSFISKLFTGRKCFAKVEGFPTELHLTPKRGGKVNYKSEPRTAFKMTRNGQVNLLTSTTESETTYQVEFK